MLFVRLEFFANCVISYCHIKTCTSMAGLYFCVDRSINRKNLSLIPAVFIKILVDWTGNRNCWLPWIAIIWIHNFLNPFQVGRVLDVQLFGDGCNPFFSRKRVCRLEQMPNLQWRTLSPIQREQESWNVSYFSSSWFNGFDQANSTHPLT